MLGEKFGVFEGTGMPKEETEVMQWSDRLDPHGLGHILALLSSLCASVSSPVKLG